MDGTLNMRIDDTVVVVASDFTETMRIWREEQQANQQQHQIEIQKIMMTLTQAVTDMTTKLGNWATTRNENPTPAAVNAGPSTVTITTNMGENVNNGMEGSRESLNNTHPTSPSIPWPWTPMSERMFPPVPKFIGEKSEIHPVRFIETIERHFRRLQIPADSQLEAVQDYLAVDATHWAEMYTGFWNNFTDFKTDFLHTYWSEARQNKMRLRISTERWDSKNMPSMMSHLAYYVSQAKLLKTAIPEQIFVSEMIRHYPIHLQSLWQAGDKTSITELAEFLRKQEATTRIVQERRVAALIQTTANPEAEPSNMECKNRTNRKRLRPVNKRAKPYKIPNINFVSNSAASSPTLESSNFQLSENEAPRR